MKHVDRPTSWAVEFDPIRTPGVTTLDSKTNFLGSCTPSNHADVDSSQRIAYSWEQSKRRLIHHASYPHEQDKNEYVTKACQTHGNDEGDGMMTRSINVANTGYYETEVADLTISDDKELRQRFIILAETIQQDSATAVATQHRKIEDVTRYPELTASNKTSRMI